MGALLPDWAQGLELQQHPEGGWFAETWRSPVELSPSTLPPGYEGSRPLATSIVFLLLPGEVSAPALFWKSPPTAAHPVGAPRHPERTEHSSAMPGLPGRHGALHRARPRYGGTSKQGRHVVRSDELWIHQRGGPLTLGLGGDDPVRPGPVRELQLGTDVPAGQSPQLLVPAGQWQTARPSGPEPVLVACVVAPGFDYRDWRLA